MEVGDGDRQSFLDFDGHIYLFLDKGRLSRVELLW